MIPNQNYRMTIVNLMKPSSLYNHGMKPVFYSDLNAKKNKVKHKSIYLVFNIARFHTHYAIWYFVKIGWIRAGADIRYYRNNLGSMSGRTFYSLTWTIQFPFQNDTCYFAHCYPYTYTDLQVIIRAYRIADFTRCCIAVNMPSNSFIRSICSC